MRSKTLKTRPKHNWRLEAIGTKWTIETPLPLISKTRQLVENRIEVFDKTYSRFRSDSLVEALARTAGEFEFPDDSDALWGFYEKLFTATNGAVSPFVGVSLTALGYDKDYTFAIKTPASAPVWNDVAKRHGRRVKTSQRVSLDFGAAGKGLLIDEIAEILESDGVCDYVIDAGGDMHIRGAPRRIGLENPFDTESVIGVIAIENESICASATNRRRWGDDIHHVVDARTGEPVRSVIATWVVAESTMVADGLATALFFVPASRLSDIARFDYVRLLADGTIEYSNRFVGQLFV